ncbi:MAG TPA: hypothetical protein VHU44_00710 [Acidobacteriaceae bacterium]|nr:hypothetical protein [Acidobacteriaceae bacterium]
MLRKENSIPRHFKPILDDFQHFSGKKQRNAMENTKPQELGRLREISNSR